MDRYRIIPQQGADWTVTEDRLTDVVRGFTGRNALAIPSVRRQLERTGRVFIAGRGQENSVTVEKLPASVTDVTHQPSPTR